MNPSDPRVLPPLFSAPADRSHALRLRGPAAAQVLDDARPLLRDAGFRETIHITPVGAYRGGSRGPDVLEFEGTDRRIALALERNDDGSAVLHIDGAGLGDEFEPLVEVLRAVSAGRRASPSED